MTLIYNISIDILKIYLRIKVNFIDQESAYYSIYRPERIKGWVGLVGRPTADGLPNKWSPVSYRSSAGQESSPGKNRRSSTVLCNHQQHALYLPMPYIRRDKVGCKRCRRPWLTLELCSLRTAPVDAPRYAFTNDTINRTNIYTQTGAVTRPLLSSTRHITNSSSLISIRFDLSMNGRLHQA